MQIKANSPAEYLSQIPEAHQEAVRKLREVILENLPQGFEEQMSYGMIGYVVPHSLYPAGYHCDPKLPLPFLSIASQKHFIAIYHMGLYTSVDLMTWLEGEYPKHSLRKLDMGKSCIRFKKTDQIPYALVGLLAAKMTPSEWIRQYESRLKSPASSKKAPK